jgi:hypothetical protein
VFGRVVPSSEFSMLLSEKEKEDQQIEETKKPLLQLILN